MLTLDILIILIFSIGTLVVIGLFMKLIVISRIDKLSREMRQVYGQENEIKKRIEQYVARKASDELSKLMQDYRESIDTQSAEVISQMRAGSLVHLESMERFIREQEQLITKQTEYIVGAVVKKAQEDIDVYKTNQLEGIDETVREIINKVAPQVLGKALSMDEHEELVWKSLERAKKEGLFLSGPAVIKVAATTSSENVVVKKIKTPKKSKNSKNLKGKK